VKPARVAMLIPWAVIEGPGGGVGRFAEALCVALAGSGMSLELFALWRHAPESEQRLRTRLAAAGVPLTIGAVWNPERPFRSLAQALRALRPVLRRNPVGLLHSHHEFGDLAAASLKLSRSAPLLLRTVHNEEWLWRPCVRRGLTGGLYPLVFAAEVGVSQEIAARLDRRRVARWRARRAHIFPNAIDLERFQRPHGERAAIRASLGLPPSGPVIGSIGRLSEQKNFAGLVAAVPLVLRHWPAARFVVVGDGPLEGALRAQIGALNLGERVVLAGPRADIEQVLPSFDVLVSSSIYEGLPTVVLESMAAGVPVVATAVSGSREAIETERTGLLVGPHDPAQMAAAICRLLADPGLRKRLADEARVAVQRYSITTVAAAYAELYAQLLS
jgi:glycosyltransferase involved in cell wall biosynthesis